MTRGAAVCRLIKAGEAKVLQFQLFILNSITKTRRVRGANAVCAENLVVLKNEEKRKSTWKVKFEVRGRLRESLCTKSTSDPGLFLFKKQERKVKQSRSNFDDY